MTNELEIIANILNRMHGILVSLAANSPNYEQDKHDLEKVGSLLGLLTEAKEKDK